jgi:hypothetical protein
VILDHEIERFQRGLLVRENCHDVALLAGIRSSVESSPDIHPQEHQP